MRRSQAPFPPPHIFRFFFVTNQQWLADLGAVFYSLKSKTYSARGDKRITEMEFNRKMEIETQMQLDRAAEEEKRRRMVEEGEEKTAGGLGRGAGTGTGGGGVGTVVKRVRTNGVVRKPDVKKGGGGGGRRRRVGGF